MRPPTGPAACLWTPAGRPGSRKFHVCDQYTIQGDCFSRAIREGGEVPVPLEEALRNMAVIEAVFRSARTGQWERPDVTER